ncbi:MAG: hypothetical protein WBP56_00230 [Polyangia bacterium]
MSRRRNFAKTFVATIAGLVVLAVVLQGTSEVATQFRTGQIAHDDGLFMLASFIGLVVGLIVGGYIAARTVGWLRASLRKPWLLLVGPGLWAWLAILAGGIASKGVATEDLAKLLLLGLVVMVTSLVGALVGARGRPS